LLADAAFGTKAVAARAGVFGFFLLGAGVLAAVLTGATAASVLAGANGGRSWLKQERIDRGEAPG
jgi:hypothetical protein